MAPRAPRALHAALDRARRLPLAAVNAVYMTAIEQASRAGRLLPQAREARRHVEVIYNLSYQSSGHAHHTLDVYRPRGLEGPAPCVLYIHGGAFFALSKDTHWVMAMTFARRGYVVFNINYRLAPRHPFPAAIEDVSAAALWVRAHAAEHGGDPSRLVIAGESAGGNLATAATLACCHEFPTPNARALYDAALRPTATVAACGILQVSDTDRFAARRKLPRYVQMMLRDVPEKYLRDVPEGALRGLADPLLFLERDTPTSRPLPPFFTFAGTRDPLLDDTRRLAAALERRGVPVDLRIYPGGIHAFHALVFQEQARTCWAEQFAFLEAALAGTVVAGA